MYLYFYIGKLKDNYTFGFEKAINLVTLKDALKLNSIKLVKAFKIKQVNIEFSDKEIIEFCEQLYIMLSSGLVIKQSLEIYYQNVGKNARNVIRNVLSNIDLGLSEAMVQTKAFPKIVTDIVKIGEDTGTLEKSFKYLYDYYRFKTDINKKIKKATIYPVVMLSLTFIFLIATSIFIFPKLQMFYSQFNSELPMITQIMIKISNLLQKTWFLLPIYFFLIFYITKTYLKNPNGKRNFDRLKLQFPLVKKIYSKVLLALFSASMYVFIKAGISVQTAFISVAKSLQNDSLLLIFLKNANKLMAGETLTDTIKNIELFPNFYIQTVYAGEMSGKLDYVFERLDNIIKEDMKTSIDMFLEKMQPLITVLVMLLVLPIILSIIIPMTSLVKQIK